MSHLIVHNGNNAISISAQSGESLSRAIWLSGQVEPAPLCSGLGRCGRCRVRFVSTAPAPLMRENEVLGAENVASGWRLACQHVVPDAETEIALPDSSFDPARGHEPPPPTQWQGAGGGEQVALAIDLGTTSIYWQFVPVHKKTAAGTDCNITVGHGHCLNPQAGAGSDVVSRLALAQNGEKRHLLAQSILALLGQLCSDAMKHGWRVACICLAGNTAMTDIVLERDISGLCAAPYHTSHAGHEWVQLANLPPLYIPFLPAPFVGGDVSAGLAWLRARQTPRPFILADMGTNGELALVTERDELFLTSVPLGPALEGIGPACGQLAGPGVITAFSLGPQGLVPTPLPGDSCKGISATGYLSLLSHLVRIGLLDTAGHFVGGQAAEMPPMPLARKIAQGLHSRRGQPCLALPGEQWLEAGDVEMLLKVRACFVVALRQLLKVSGVPVSGLAKLCLAGALGEHVLPENLETLGFVPHGLAGRIEAVGNSSLKGAALLATDTSKGEELAAWCARATIVPLVEQADFQLQYMQAMRLEMWT